MKKLILSVDTSEELIAELENEINRIKEFVKLAETYPTDTVEQKAIKYYAYIGKVKEVADKLNEEGHRIGNRKWQSNDVTAIIDKPSNEPLEILVRENFRKRKANVPYLR